MNTCHHFSIKPTWWHDKATRLTEKWQPSLIEIRDYIKYNV